MDLGLSGCVILVSGGGSGIGQAISRLCLAEGARVVVAGRQTPEVVRFKREMQQARPGLCQFVTAELAEAPQCEAVVALVRSHHGRLDGLVNNAGANNNISLETGDPARFEQSLRQNLLHYYSLAHFSLPLLKQSRGSIVNISSKVAVTGQGGTSAYAAAKGAQLALTREWAAELLPYGIRVNAVVPAEVLTPLYEEWLRQQEPAISLHTVAQRVPLGGRMTAASEVAAAVVFLLSSKQSGHTTAQHVYVDGGYAHLDRALTFNRADEV